MSELKATETTGRKSKAEEQETQEGLYSVNPDVG